MLIKENRQQAVLHFIRQLESDNVMMHGFILKHRGQIVAEGYYQPFRRGEPHRMYSVSKTATALAIGLLIKDKRIWMEDPIIRYFPDKLPVKVPDEMAAMTIGDMLCMKSCFCKTVFQAHKDQDWIRSFFHATPAHYPGTVFSYDSSASHVLCALVERMCGEEILKFLQRRLFSALHMQDAKRWLKDPSGVSQGASGLILSLRDLSLLTEFLMTDGKGLLETSFLRDAAAMQSVTLQRRMPEERYGYGYQLWRLRRGFAMFGMGGQLGIALQEQDLTLCTIADTRFDETGVQAIYDAFFRYIADADLTDTDANDQQCLEETLASLACPSVNVGAGAQKMHFGKVIAAPNSMGIQWFTLDGNQLHLETDEGSFTLPYGMGENVQSACRGEPCMASAGWPDAHTFYLRCYYIGDTPCGFDVTISWRGPQVTLRLTRTPDPLTDGMEGEACGILP